MGQPGILMPGFGEISEVPAGTAERIANRILSIVPSGLGSIAFLPGVETPGYCRTSLRDFYECVVCVTCVW